MPSRRRIGLALVNLGKDNTEGCQKPEGQDLRIHTRRRIGLAEVKYGNP
jgi:hypothetical protein